MHFENDADLYRVIGANIKHYRAQAKLTQLIYFSLCLPDVYISNRYNWFVSFILS